MQFTDAERSALFRLLEWRRDVRHFLPDPVPDALVEDLRCAMDLAPSVGNSRPWRVLSVESAKHRQAVRAIFGEANHRAASAYQGAQLAHYQSLKLEGIEIAPVQLAIFTAQDPQEGAGLGRRSVPQTLEHSTAMAVQNLNLVARSYGLGVGMVSILDPEAMAQLFAVPADWRFSLYLCIGWPQHNDSQPLLHRNGWQQNCQTSWEVV
ncbi:5,6-dimethylbenzimidazole synthase [Mesorhizobium sp. RP14(2022)]|uniref:5,6-dimethylbenzimidazole synthase n=1 Tax=Mesorhizobium liriopis TaxID=2953882 RepID=A0ABT1C834_9HYPH|nr:5,6-dimethylbenzimidazole synthase [Mesorhizobium liriopis]MCO6050996.1 5,6-dimethylbenzimidazole synthase [Mesorhizobium liriopis]